MEVQQIQQCEPELQTQQRQAWDAFHITEHVEGKPRWVPIGIAFLNRDQSINIFLDAFPKDGKVQLRDRSERKNKQTKGENNES